MCKDGKMGSKTQQADTASDCKAWKKEAKTGDQNKDKKGNAQERKKKYSTAEKDEEQE